MVNVSKYPLSKRRQDDLYQKLVTYIAVLNKQNATPFLDEFFTESERTVFLKRFSAIFMFSEGLSSYRVAHTLHLSTATAEKYRGMYLDGKFDHIVHVLQKRKRSKKEFWDLIEKISRAGLPPRGKGRWTTLKER